MGTKIIKLPSLILAVFALIGVAAHAEPTLWIGDSAGRLGKVDVASGAATVVGTMSAVMTDIAFDPIGNLYGITFDSLYRINPNTASTTFIGSLGTNLNSLVFDSRGTLYAANNSLYTINTSTGVASRIGNGGIAYSSSGDLAFIAGSLYLSSAIPASDTLIRLNPTTGSSAAVGPIGVSSVFGLATSDNVNLYAVSGTSIYAVNTVTGGGTFLADYSGYGMASANGTAFISESAAPIPEPDTSALLATGLSFIGTLLSFSRHRASNDSAAK